MDTLSFLKRVLPATGRYCAWTKTPRGNRQRFFDSVEDLCTEVTERDRAEQNTFFAISTFGDDNTRKKSNVAATKVLALDLDCGPDKPFSHWKKALAAFGTFAKAQELPPPLIVRSGNGLHVYWVLDIALEPAEWTALASALKEAAKANGLEIDNVAAANSALVLRPVGTHNWKDPDNPKEVKVLINGADTTVAEMKKALAYYHTPATTKKRTSALTDAMAVPSDFPPAVAKQVVDKCAQIQWIVENQDRVSEPLWYCVLGVAAHTVDPEDTAKRWSENHPQYSEAETLKKLDQWRSQSMGPTTCARFEAERPSGCKGCPYAGKIGSPAALGAQFAEADLAAEAPEEVEVRIEAPKPFKHIANNGGMAVHIDGADVKVCDFNIYPLSYGYDEALGYEVAQFLWDRPHVGWKVLTVRQAYLAPGATKEFTGAIADQGILLDTRTQTEHFHMLLRSYINKLRKAQTVTNLYSTMGWKEDFNVFVLGDTLLRRADDGSVKRELIRLSSNAHRVGSDMFCTGGELATWQAAVKLLERGKLRAHQFSLAIGFSSPLYAFTGLKGVTVSFYGESGGGKSLAQVMQQSIWGDPEKLHMQSKFTQNSLFTRFATHGNLPMTIDEATQMSDRDVADYLYSVSQGRDKARLDKNATERAPREWALSSTLSTNKPLAAKLTTAGHEMDAQLARLLELRVSASPLFADSSDFGRKVYRVFTAHYGWAGLIFMSKLMEMSQAEIQKMIDDAPEKFRKRYGVRFKGVERYWEHSLVMADLSLRLAKKWGLIDFEPEECIRWALDQLDEMRETIAENQRDMFDYIAEYLNAHASEMVRVFHNPGSAPYCDKSVEGTIRARIDGYRSKSSGSISRGVLLLDRAHFRKWFASQGQNPRELMAELVANGADATPKSQKASLGKHTPVSLPQCYVVGVDLAHPRMAGVLDEMEQVRKDLEIKELSNVIDLGGGLT